MASKSNRIFFLGNRYIIAYLAFLSSFAPISTDMYLPALPMMAENLAASEELVSLTISGFLFTFAISMLFWGPLSDRFGRKPVLLIGAAIYIVSSSFIAITDSIYILLFWRIVQAIGSGASAAMSLAIVKDLFRGVKMEKIVSVLQAAHIIAPISAPLLGGWLLLVVSWRGIFWCLTICGCLAFLGAIAYRETGPKNPAKIQTQSFKAVGYVLRQTSFLYPLLIFSVMSMPFFSYLAVSAFIFQTTFGVSAQDYSMFFALNAGCSLLGPFAHIYFFRHFNRNNVISLHIAIMGIAAFLVIMLGINGPWFFTLLFAPVTFCGSAMRPPSTVLMMQSIKGHNGVVSSLINCGGLLCGSLSMAIASLAFWSNNIIAVGVIGCVSSFLCLIGWLLIKKENINPQIY